MQCTPIVCTQCLLYRALRALFSTPPLVRPTSQSLQTRVVKQLVAKDIRVAASRHAYVCVTRASLSVSNIQYRPLSRCCSIYCGDTRAIIMSIRYCDECVCLSVCSHSLSQNYMPKYHEIFCTRYLWPSRFHIMGHYRQSASWRQPDSLCDMFGRLCRVATSVGGRSGSEVCYLRLPC